MIPQLRSTSTCKFAPRLVLKGGLAYRLLLLGIELQLRGLLLELRDGRLLVQVDLTCGPAVGFQRGDGRLLLIEVDVQLADRTAGLLDCELGLGGGRLLHLHLPLDLRDIEAAVLDAKLHLGLLELAADEQQQGGRARPLSAGD